jgi:predicted nucleic acid-binding protein
MENLVIADTDVIIDFFSGAEPSAGQVASLVANQSLALTAISVFELYAGVSGLRRLGQIDAIVSLARVFPFGTEDALAAASVYNAMKKSGNLIGAQDILIAGVCISRKLPLLTRNKGHFSRIPGLHLSKML